MITKHSTSRTLVVHSLSQFDALRVEHYRNKLRGLIEEGYRSIIFDLIDTPHINSSGLGLLVEFYNTLQRLGGTFKLINCNQQVLWLLHQSHLDTLLSDSICEANEPSNEPAQSDERARFDRLHEMMSSEILLLTQINAVIGQTLQLDDPIEIGELILRGLLKALRASRGALLLLNTEETQLSLVRWIGRAIQPGEQTSFPFKYNRMEYRLLEDDEIVWRRLADEQGDDFSLFRLLGFDNLVLAPVRGKTRKFGLLAIEATEDTERIVQAARPIIRTFAQLGGHSLEKAQLVHDLRDSNDELNEALERLRVSHQSLLNAGRLATLGTVISGLGHQLNNKLVPVLGYCQLLARKDLGTDALAKVDVIQTASTEMQLIIEKLLRLSRVRERSSTVFDPHETLRTALDLLCGHIEGQRIRVELQLAGETPLIGGDGDLFLQAILAILHRSCTTFSDDQSDRWIRIVTTVHESNLRVEIEDNGLGLGDYDTEDWLDPLVPLEEIGHGQIFNYTIPRNLIRRHRGLLEVANRTGGGKRAVIDLQLG